MSVNIINTAVSQLAINLYIYILKNPKNVSLSSSHPVSGNSKNILSVRGNICVRLCT